MTEDTIKGDASLGHTSQMRDAPSEMGEKEEGTESRIYEVGYLIVPTVSEGELPREVTTLKDTLDKEKAVTISEEFPKLRALAYTMQKRAGEKYEKHSNGYFGWVKFDAQPEAIRRIEALLKRAEKVLRFLVIKTVRENTMTVPRAPRLETRRLREAPKSAPHQTPGTPISEQELEKSLEKIIAE